MLSQNALELLGPLTGSQGQEAQGTLGTAFESCHPERCHGVESATAVEVLGTAPGSEAQPTHQLSLERTVLE